MALVTAGPGRSATSLLADNYTGYAFTRSCSSWRDDARVGLEVRVQAVEPLRSSKGLWFREDAEELGPAAIAPIDILQRSIGSWQHTVASCPAGHRGFETGEARTLGSSWWWRTGGYRIRGGIPGSPSAEHVSIALGEALWEVLPWATRNEIPLRLGYFCLFAQYFAYCWSRLRGLHPERMRPGQCEEDPDENHRPVVSPRGRRDGRFVGSPYGGLDCRSAGAQPGLVGEE